MDHMESCKEVSGMKENGVLKMEESTVCSRHLSPLKPLEDECDIALVLLNTPFDRHSRRLKHFWKRSVLTACVDGAATNLHSCGPIDDDEYIPDFITGDFDSAVEDTLDYYRSKGSKIIPTPDQNLTDFTKCLQIVIDNLKSTGKKVDCVVVCVSFGEGRFDHVMGNINTLFLTADMTDTPIYLYSAQSIITLLKKGRNVIDVKSEFRGQHCGLVPIGQPCNDVTTTGLKWNLKNQGMKFGGLISTSNGFADDVITVDTDTALLWTMSILPE